MASTKDRLEELIRSNQPADAAALRRAQQLIEELWSSGWPRSRYDLISPYDKRPPTQRRLPAKHTASS
ncbi:MAG TPA: hypothetical protein VNH82_11920 [Candidatus Dormibacteraeota bacterium]|nr:hypothetical protein [Candidatus Dormibacteraeota bacterium]